MITDSLLNIIKEIDISNQSSISETNSLFLLIKNLLIINQEKNELVSLI
jgi:hypothetical protein